MFRPRSLTSLARKKKSRPRASIALLSSPLCRSLPSPSRSLAPPLDLPPLLPSLFVAIGGAFWDLQRVVAYDPNQMRDLPGGRGDPPLPWIALSEGGGRVGNMADRFSGLVLGDGRNEGVHQIIKAMEDAESTIKQQVSCTAFWFHWNPGLWSRLSSQRWILLIFAPFEFFNWNPCCEVRHYFSSYAVGLRNFPIHQFMIINCLSAEQAGRAY